MSSSVTSREAALAVPRQRRPSSAQNRGVKQTSRERVLGYLLIAPIVIVMLVVIAFPLVNAVTTSLQNERTIGSPAEFVWLDTYATVVGNSAFWEALGRSGIWLILNMVIQSILAFTTALLLQRTGRWSRTARTWIVLPWVIPTVAVAVVWEWMLNSNYGVITYLLRGVGIDIGSPFGDPSVALIAVVLVNSWHWFPLSAVVIYGALATIPEEMLEAAKMDGAGAWRSFWAVTFPLLQPVLFALALVGSLWSFNVFDTVYLITGGGPVAATTTMPVFVYDTAFSAFRSSQAAAASVLTVIVLGIAALLFVRFARPKEEM